MLKKTKDFRLAEWKKILTEANSSGMSKRAWCKANGINERKLYYLDIPVRGNRLSGGLETASPGLRKPVSMRRSRHPGEIAFRDGDAS